MPGVLLTFTLFLMQYTSNSFHLSCIIPGKDLQNMNCTPLEQHHMDLGAQEKFQELYNLNVHHAYDLCA